MKQNNIHQTKENQYSMGWLLPLLLILLTAGMINYFVEGVKKTETGYIPGTDTATLNARMRDSIQKKEDSVLVKINTDTAIWAKRNGIEQRLLDYLTSKNAADTLISKLKWFDFDRVTFEEGTSKITGIESEQLRNISSILNAYPKVKIKIIVFMPKGGNEAMNRSSSQLIADSIATELKKYGARNDQVLGGEGYGSYYAQYDENASEEQKRKDMRIAINVIAK